MRYLSLLFCICLSFGLHAQSSPSFAELKLTMADDIRFPLTNTIRFTINTYNADKVVSELVAWPSIIAKKLDDSHVSITMSQRPVFDGEVTQAHTADTFVIDYSEPSSQQFIQQFKASTPGSWELSALPEFVGEYITETTYIHGFNIASVVATQRSGDCTEHAVLTTALARALGLPARVVIGSVLVENPASVTAFGHAWAEVWYQEQWHILDAALVDSGAEKHFYLPAGVVTNEGPGFGFGLATATGAMPIQITQLTHLIDQ